MELVVGESGRRGGDYRQDKCAHEGSLAHNKKINVLEKAKSAELTISIDLRR